jgi:hypothetical protein
MVISFAGGPFFIYLPCFESIRHSHKPTILQLKKSMLAQDKAAQDLAITLAFFYGLA